VAAIYHYVFGWQAPYPLISLPVLLGISGGVGLIVGPAGLLWVKYKRDLEPVDEAQTGMDVSFLALLLLAGVTGLSLLALRQGEWMGIVLALHLGSVMALFLILPFGKFVHGLYRLAALAQFHLETARHSGGKATEAADIGTMMVTMSGDSPLTDDGEN
jgi:citrate/tricarballylate utilization protein